MGYNFSNCIDFDTEDLPKQNRLVISFESLPKIDEQRNEVYDLVILDECEPLLIHFFFGNNRLNTKMFPSLMIYCIL
jgi:hypothetical protein